MLLPFPINVFPERTTKGIAALKSLLHISIIPLGTNKIKNAVITLVRYVPVSVIASIVTLIVSTHPAIALKTVKTAVPALSLMLCENAVIPAVTKLPDAIMMTHHTITAIRKLMYIHNLEYASE